MNPLSFSTSLHGNYKEMQSLFNMAVTVKPMFTE